MPPARGRGASHGNKQHKGRLPAGTPPMLRVKDHKEVERAKRDQIGKVTEVFRSDEFKAWLRARNVGEGMMDMSVSINTGLIVAIMGGSEWLGKENEAPRVWGCS